MNKVALGSLLLDFNKSQAESLLSSKHLDDFDVGDTIIVETAIYEGGVAVRTQNFQGLCIGRFKGKKSLNSSIVVRKISHGEGVERRFNICSPWVKSIKLVRRGRVRRAKLYYMSKLSGKAARVEEKRDRVSDK